MIAVQANAVYFFHVFHGTPKTRFRCAVFFFGTDRQYEADWRLLQPEEGAFFFFFCLTHTSI